MAERVVKVTLRAQVAEYQAGMLKAAQATRTVGTEAEKLAQKREAFETLGRGLLITGAAMVATAALTVRAAGQWESAWAGVTKTVDGTPEQLEKVEQGLRDLSKVLPASHTEIAAVAEAAGQLGVETDNVVAFTRVMIDLGETTNLSANDAATALARFTNIMGTSPEKVSNLGSALVGLGNNYATTESEILEMSMRLAGAGKQIGLSEGDVLGLSTALSSVGIEAEAGGSAMSKVMIDIAASVEEGGERVQMFAEVAGMSADDFSQKWRTAPADALSAFVKGLANAEGQGKSTLGVLGELEITEVRMRDALLRSASAADEFSGAMAAGNEEFDKGNALALEAEKRYATVESKLAMAGNAINDAAISFGQVLLPAVGAAAEAVAGIAGFLGDLPGPVQGVITVLGGLTGVIALAGGAALLAVPRFAMMKTSMDTLGWSMKGLSVAGGIVGVALTALVGIIGAVGAAHQANRQRAESYADALRQSEGAARDVAVAALQAEDSWLWMSRGSAFDAAEKLGIGLDVVTDAAMGNADALDDLSLYLRAADGDMDALRDITERTGMSNVEAAGVIDVLVGAIREQNDGLTEAERLTKQAGDATEEVTPKVATFEEEVSAAESALNDMNQALEDVGGTALGMGDAIDRAQSAVNRLGDAAEEDGVSIDGINDSSIKFRDSIRDVETSARDAAQAILDNGGSVDAATEAYRTSRDAILDTISPYFESRDAAAAWADKNLGSASDVESALADVADAVNSIPTNKAITVTAYTDQAYGAMEQLVRTYNGRTLRLNVATDSFAIPNNAAGAIWKNGVKEFAAGDFLPGVYPATPGGIHRFAEAGYAESYISMDPKYHDRSVGIWQETGRRLGVQGGGDGVAANVDALAERIVNALLSRPSLTINNPLSRDASRDAYEAQQMLGG